MAAPLLISIYTRFEHLRRCINSLQTNNQASNTDLFIVSDAPYKPEDSETINQIREYVPTIQGFKSVNLIAWEKNKGSTASIFDARALIFKQYDRLIFMEDDNIVSPHFLDYINSGLDRYENNPEIYCICGYNYNIPIPKGYSSDAFFMYNMTAYGYGVWKDKYETFYREYNNPDFTDKEYKGYARKLQQPAFFLRRMVKKNVIWGDVRVTYYLYSKRMTALFPCHSLVTNTGFDNSGEHCGNMNVRQQDIQSSIPIKNYPTTTTIDAGWEKAIQDYLSYPMWRRWKTCFYDWRMSLKRKIKNSF